MIDLGRLGLQDDMFAALPDGDEIVGHLHNKRKPSARDVLVAAESNNRPLLQPRCGVGGHTEMTALLRRLEVGGAPGMLSVTIDSHTRLRRFAEAATTLRNSPENLNGYPLVTHGWRRGRELDACVRVPLEIRHGSPDARVLFATSLAAGITSFEGGGISYNLPYCKNVPLSRSLADWQSVDAICGDLAKLGIIVERELFGTLTAVLVPPSTSIAISLLEALSAAEAGVRCVSVAYPQGGEIHQDVAALRAIRSLGAHYLPPGVRIFPVLHQFMGVFPAVRSHADAMIFYGALTARLGEATKIVTKTRQEAFGVPELDANIDGLRLSAVALSEHLDFITVDGDRVAEEHHWIEREVAELIEPVLGAGDLPSSIAEAFSTGRLDIPFSASIYAHSDVIPMRDPSGATRYFKQGALPFSKAVKAYNDARLSLPSTMTPDEIFSTVTADIQHFAARETEESPTSDWSVQWTE